MVLEGSMDRKDEVPSIHPYMSDMRARLRSEGILADQGDHYRFRRDYEFNSRSTAGGVLLGRSANGLIEWRTSDGRTLKQLQEAQPSSLLP